MVSELEVSCLDFDFGHVTRRAIFIRYRTTGRGACLRRLAFQWMTGQASVVIVSRVLLKRFVRIMTSSAAYIAIG